MLKKIVFGGRLIIRGFFFAGVLGFVPREKRGMIYLVEGYYKLPKNI
jgi:hypothetical protein